MNALQIQLAQAMYALNVAMSEAPDPETAGEIEAIRDTVVDLRIKLDPALAAKL